MDFGLLAIAVFLLIFSLSLNVSGNFWAKLLFKVLPFFSGMYLLFYFFVEIGILIL